MNRFFYDLHLHSCLSPCGDGEMTPNNLVNMAMLSGLHIIALTDHNTCRNCPAAAKVAEQVGLGFLPGMELTTAEEVHVVFLFPTVEKAMVFDEYVTQRRMPVRNKPEIFGDQLVLDEDDIVIDREDILLITATSISVDQTPALAEQFGGVCWPAHIDRSSYSILSNLGYIPVECVFPAVEVHNPAAFFADSVHENYRIAYPIITSSDAHRLEDIAEAKYFFDSEQEEPWAVLTDYLGV